MMINHNKSETWGWEVDQYMNYLLYKHKDLSLNSQNPAKQSKSQAAEP